MLRIHIKLQIENTLQIVIKNSRNSMNKVNMKKRKKYALYLTCHFQNAIIVKTNVF
jgi:hypothetical protein